MSKTERNQKFFSILKSEGYVPEIDKDGDVKFKFEGSMYYIILDDKDDEYFRICLPMFLQLSDEDRVKKAAVAANHANRTIKAVKVFSVDTYMWASIETFVNDNILQGKMILRMLGAMQAGVRAFAEKMKEIDNQ